MNKQIKTRLWCGLIFLVLGLSMIFGGGHYDKTYAVSMGFGCCGAGGANLWLFIQWWRNKEAYEERLHRAQIESKDEMLVLLRRQAGHMTYLLTMLLLAVATLVCTVCMGFGLWLPYTRYGLYWTLAATLFEYIAGVVIFKWIKNRY